MTQEFIGENITPLPGAFDTAAMATGAPGLPSQFTWRQKTYTITKVLKAWKESSPCRHGSSEMYLRKHWYNVQTDQKCSMTIYFTRQSRSSSQAKKRWWLYTITTP